MPESWGDMDPEDRRGIWVALAIIVAVVALAYIFGGPAFFNP